MNVITANNFCDAYQRIIQSLIQKKSFYEVSTNLVETDAPAPRGKLTYELFNCLVKINDPTENLFTNATREPNLKYLAGELIWYLSGRQDVDFISKYSKFWKTIADEDGNCNSAYGARIFVDRNETGLTEWQWAQSRLLLDTDTRQAIIRFNKPKHSHPNTKDFVCTLTAAFHIRYGSLHMSTNMRSQDVFWGIVYDIPFFSLVQQLMVAQLNRLNPKLNLKVGTYTHYVHSLHMYDHNAKQLEDSMSKSHYTSAKLPKVTDPAVFLNEDGLLSDSMLNLADGKINEKLMTDDLYNWIVTNSGVRENA